MYIFICFEVLNFLAIDKNSVKGGDNVTECLVNDSPPGGVTECLIKGIPTRGVPPNIPVTGDSPYWDPPPSS